MNDSLKRVSLKMCETTYKLNLMSSTDSSTFQLISFPVQGVSAQTTLTWTVYTDNSNYKAPQIDSTWGPINWTIELHKSNYASISSIFLTDNGWRSHSIMVEIWSSVIIGFCSFWYTTPMSSTAAQGSHTCCSNFVSKIYKKKSYMAMYDYAERFPSNVFPE